MQGIDFYSGFRRNYGGGSPPKFKVKIFIVGSGKMIKGGANRNPIKMQV